MKDKFKKFVRQHWIFIWALLSVVYAAIVQLLFSLKTSNQFLVAHWGAGDILTYASTISLGLLAMWQNKKQQEENDITQERMERIIIHANELSIISKMIEHEERRVNELDKLLNRFMQNCDPQAVAIAYSSDDKIVCMTQVTELERTIDKDFFAISRLLAEDKVLKLDPDNALKVAFAKLYQTVKKDIGDICQEKIDIIVNGFQPVFHIHRFFVKGVYLSNIKVGGDNLIESIKLLFSKIVLCYFYIRTTDFVMLPRGKPHIFFFCIGTLIDYFCGGMLVGSPVHFILNLFEEQNRAFSMGIIINACCIDF